MRELSLHILDIMQNSLEAGATQVELVIDENLAADQLTITIRDNGRGMDEATLARVMDPFYTTRTTRKVGLGIPLFQVAAERCAGALTIESQVGRGTTLKATFQHSHIDRAPLGDIAGTLMSVILGGTCELHYVHRVTVSRRGDGETGRQGDKETRRQGDRETGRQGDRETREFEFRTEEIKAELGDLSLTHPAVREWLQQFISEGEATLPTS